MMASRNEVVGVGSILLVPWAKTSWSEAGRFSGRAPLPLSDAGRMQAEAWSDKLATTTIKAVYSSNEQAGIETARNIAERCNVRHRIVEELAEMNTGLWAGLTDQELKRRYAKVFKKWWSDPTSAAPPDGEAAVDALERLRDAVNEVTQKQAGKSFVVVLGPLAFGLVRCMMESAELEKLRSMMQAEPLKYQLVE
jgi:probable phosphoglycerate mutase